MRASSLRHVAACGPPRCLACATTSRRTHAAASPADEEADLLFSRRLEKAERLRAEGGEPYAYGYAPTHTAAELAAQWSELAAGAEDEAAVVAVSGRVLTKRLFGKLAFFTVQDATGTVQLYLEKRRMGDAFGSFLAATDGGDIVGASGTVKRTKTGELSVAASEASLLTKALRPLPDKWQGLTDVNTRYRQRYLDMLVNPRVRHTLEQRARITAYLRRALDDAGFLEVETPALHAVAGGADARPFETHHNALGMDVRSPRRAGKGIGAGRTERAQLCPHRRGGTVDAAHRHRAAPQAARRRRRRPRVRARPRLSQRGHLHASQPGVHVARALPGRGPCHSPRPARHRPS